MASFNIDLDPTYIVTMLNTLLALEPKLVLSLVSNRPTLELDQTKEYLKMKGTKLSFIGIINAMLIEHGSAVLVGAECEFEDGELEFVKFFHLVEREIEE